MPKKKYHIIFLYDNIIEFVSLNEERPGIAFDPMSTELRKTSRAALECFAFDGVGEYEKFVKEANLFLKHLKEREKARAIK